jgi:hypothetical protein
MKLRAIKQRDIRLRALADLHTCATPCRSGHAWPPSRPPANGPRAPRPNARGACLPTAWARSPRCRPTAAPPLACPAPSPCPASAKPTKGGPAEALSDEVDLETLLLTDDGLSFHREGVGPDVVARLRRGHWAIQRELDLHGLRREKPATNWPPSCARPAARLALPARGAWQGAGLAGPRAGAQGQGAALAGPAWRRAGLHAGQRTRKAGPGR